MKKYNVYYVNLYSNHEYTPYILHMTDEYFQRVNLKQFMMTTDFEMFVKHYKHISYNYNIIYSTESLDELIKFVQDISLVDKL